MKKRKGIISCTVRITNIRKNGGRFELLPVCDIESRVKEMRLLLNPVEIAAALELLEVMQHQHGPKNSP